MQQEKTVKTIKTMTTREEVIAFCKTFPDVIEDYPFRDTSWTCMRNTATRRIFAWIFERQGHIWVNVKVSPQWRDFFRDAFPAVVPGYHMNKEHWNSIILDGSMPAKEIERMIAESYDLCTGKKG